MYHGLADGRRVRCLNVVDDCTEESIVTSFNEPCGSARMLVKPESIVSPR